MISERTPAARRSASVIFQCGLAVVLVAAALTATLLLQSVVSTAGYLFFYAAVVASAWFGGKWSGWLAVILSTVASRILLHGSGLFLRSESGVFAHLH